MWLGMPPNSRQPDEKTAKEFAEKIGVREETLSRWRQDALVRKVSDNAMKLYGGNSKLEVINAIIESAKHGNSQAQRLYLEWQGELVSKTKGLPAEFSVKYIEE
jgi:hypothetical protein